MDGGHGRRGGTIGGWAGALGAGALAALWGAAALASDMRDTYVARVIDGDTFEVAGGDRVRIRNFDTAELRNYDCDEERVAAVEARRAARQWLDDRRVTLILDGQDRWGRLVADVIVHGPDGPFNFADRMTDAGVGARWEYGREPQPSWCPDPEPFLSRAAQAIAWLLGRS